MRSILGAVVGAIGGLLLAADALLSLPLLLALLRDPGGPDAEVAGMTAFFVIFPTATLGVVCLLVASLLRFGRIERRFGWVAWAVLGDIACFVAFSGIVALILCVPVAVAGPLAWEWLRTRAEDNDEAGPAAGGA